MLGIEENTAGAKRPSITLCNNKPVDLSTASKKLTEGFLCIYQNPLQHIKNELDDLIYKQEKSIMQSQLENKKFNDAEEDIELHDLFSSIEAYKNKILIMKKELVTIHEKAFKLKRRALRFQQLKLKEAANKEE